MPCRDRPVEFVCAGAVGRVLQDSARCADHLRGQVQYSPCGIIVNVTPFRAGVGRLRHARDLEHHTAAGEDLRQRMPLPNFLLPVGRGLRYQLQGSRGKVPGAERDCAAEAVGRHSALSRQLSGSIVGTRWFGRRRVPREPFQDSPFEFLWSRLVRSSVNCAGHLPNDYLGRVFRLDDV
jgi:hypothetical protein